MRTINKKRTRKGPITVTSSESITRSRVSAAREQEEAKKVPKKYSRKGPSNCSLRESVPTRKIP
jgi:hypothetical protein